jgi:predicted nucleic acid-binding protein
MIVLVDTSVWIDHQRGLAPHLTYLLSRQEAAIHSGVIGELACGSLADRASYLMFLRRLPQVSSASDSEVLFLLEIHQLFGRGAGFLDLHILAAASINSVPLWTNDLRLAKMAAQLNVPYLPKP